MHNVCFPLQQFFMLFSSVLHIHEGRYWLRDRGDFCTHRCHVLYPLCCLWGDCGNWLCANVVVCLCHAAPSSPLSTTMRCGSNDWMAPSQSCTSPSCRKANTLSSTRKNTHAYRQRPSSLLCLFLSPFCVVPSYILAICTDTRTQTHLTSPPLCISNKKRNTLKNKYQPFLKSKEMTFSVNMYVCWYYWQGHKVSFSLEWRSMQSAAKKNY